MIILNEVQQIAFKLIQLDANVIYNIIKINNDKKINSNNNYICMLLPYIGLFANQSEIWGNKVKLQLPRINEVEIKYYEYLRNNIKLFNMQYSDLKNCLKTKIDDNDSYFYRNRTSDSLETGIYYNIGADKTEDKFSGNTILISTYIPWTIEQLEEKNNIKQLSIVVGKLSTFYTNGNVKELVSKDINAVSIDFNWYQNNIFKDSTVETLCYFSIVCSINYIIEFIENLFIEELPQKFKWAYLLYYYLCDLIKEINKIDKINFKINDSYRNVKFRNCIAHYGLGQFIKKEDIIYNDLLFGLTQKAFNKNYFEMKEIIYCELRELSKQIECKIFVDKK